MTSLGDYTVTINLEPSEKVRELIAAEVEKQLAGKCADLLKEIEARVDPKTLARAVSAEIESNVRVIGGRRMEQK